MVSVLPLSVALAAMLALGACARAPSPETWDEVIAAREQRAAIRFDNEAQVVVDVYLVGERREWRLGRVAPGARAVLRVPEEALVATPGFVRLAVLAGAPLSMAVARDPDATFTIEQPASELVSQRFTFSERQRLLGLRADVRRR